MNEKKDDEMFKEYKSFREGVLSWLTKEQLIELVFQQEHLLKKARDRVKAYQRAGVKYAT